MLVNPEYYSNVNVVVMKPGFGQKHRFLSLGEEEGR
jgi:hypothetical protein